MATTTKLVNPIHPDFHGYLDPDFIDYYNTHLAIRPATNQVKFSEVRANPEKFRARWSKDFSDNPRVHTFEITSDDGTKFKARSYKPDPEKYGSGPYPIHINYHGGGFCFGDLNEDAEWCMAACDEVGIVILDIDYRLCPENKFGKGTEDGWAALKWVLTNYRELNSRPDSVSIGGVSAGAFMSCVYQHMARDEGIKLKLALLCVPTGQSRDNFEKPEDAGFESYVENANAPFLNWARLMYLKDVVGDRTIVPKLWNEPLFATNFARICDTFIATAGADPVRDEGEEYGMKIVRAGGKVTFRRYTGVPHIFQHMKELEKTKLYYQDTFVALKNAHGL